MSKDVYNLDVPGIDSKNLESRRSIEPPVDTNTARNSEILLKPLQMLVELQQKPELNTKPQVRKDGSKTERSAETSLVNNKSRAGSKDKSVKLREATVIQNLAKKTVLKNVGKLGINSNDLIAKTTKHSTISFKDGPKLGKTSMPRKSIRINEKSKLPTTTESDEISSIQDFKKKANSTNQFLEITKLDGASQADINGRPFGCSCWIKAKAISH